MADSDIKRPRAGLAGVVAMLALAAGIVTAQPAWAGVMVRATPTTPAAMTVNQVGALASFELRNMSTPPDGATSYNVTSFRMSASCAATTVSTCTTPDPGVLAPSLTGSGRAGTVCGGIAFTIGAPDANNVRTVTYPGTITLGPVGGGSESCIVDFTLDALKMPTIDASVIAGVQTLVVGYLSVTLTGGGPTNSSFASTTVTLIPVTPAPPPSDFDGDTKSDIAVYRPSTGIWYVSRSGGGSSVVNWGSSGDLSAAGDYDGDAKADFAVFRPSSAIWYVSRSAGGTTVLNWGAMGDTPMPEDFDGDHKADIAVYRPGTGVWYISRSGGGSTVVNWGSPGDIPAAGDFDGDGKADLAVFRPSTAIWYISRSTGGTTVLNWGANGDVPKAGDYDGDGKTDIAVYRPSTGIWYVSRSGGGSTVINWGSPGDVPAAGDYDGDAKTDFAVFRPSTAIWYVSRSTGGTTILNWGANGDVPIGPPPA